MIIGDPKRFAIQSEITKAYTSLGIRALGFFQIHLAGKCYGVKAPDATLLACSLDVVEERIVRRGEHTAPFATVAEAGMIADAYRDVIYAPDQEDMEFLGISFGEFHCFTCSNQLAWAPDGDEAFDDWSFVLQFDIGNQVRLIGFMSLTEGYHHDPKTLTDVWIDADEYYDILKKWRDAFLSEWAAAPKIHEGDITYH